MLHACGGLGTALPRRRRLGAHRITFVSLLAVAVGLAGRALVHHEIWFLLLSMLALAGMAMANVLLPSLVRLHFPDRIGRVTAAVSVPAQVAPIQS